MTRDVQPPDPGAEDADTTPDTTPDTAPDVDPSTGLLSAAGDTTAAWMRRVTERAARRGGVDPAGFTDELDHVATAATERLLADLRVLLATDVDEQRTNPLSLYRSAVLPANELLTRRGVARPPDDGFSAGAFPGDPYRLGPATWSDISDEMHEAGIRWGAWKAMTVLRRRRG